MMELSSFVQITIPKELYPNLDKTNNIIQWNVKSSDMVQKGDILGVVLLTTTLPRNEKDDNKLKTPFVQQQPGKIIRAKKRGRKTDIAAATKAYSTADSSNNKNNNETKAQVTSKETSTTITSRKPPTGMSRYLQNLSSSLVSNGTTTTPSKSSNLSSSFSSTDHTIRSPISGIITIYTKCQSQHNNNNNNNNNNDQLQSWVIAKVEACTHSTVMDGLCVICGKPVNKNDDYNNTTATNKNDDTINNNKHSIDETKDHRQPMGELLTVSGGVTVQINSEEARRQMADATLQKLRKDRKLQLVLDIDHTLLHATADPNASYFYSNIPDCKTLLLPIQQHPNMKVTLLRHYVKLRPYICELFLSPEILDNYEISIYTAGTRNYAEQVTNILCRYFINYKRKNSNTKEKGCCLGEEQLQQLEQAVTYAKARYEASKQTEQENSNQKEHSKTTSTVTKESSIMNDKNGTNNVHPKVDTKESTSTHKDKKSQEKVDKCKNNLSESESSTVVEHSNMSSAISAQSQYSNDSKNALDNKEIQESISHNEQEESEDSLSKPDSNCKMKGILRINKKRRKDSEDSDNGDKNENAIQKRMRVSFSSTPPDIKIIASRKCQDAEETWKQLSKEYEVALDLENQAQQLRRQIFGSRIISRTDVGDLGRDVKSLQRVFPCGGKMAVVVDDREDVWANGIQQNQGGEPPPNLLVVKPYHWKPFLGFADVNNAAGADITRDPNMNNNLKQMKNNKSVDWNKNKLLEHQKEEEKEIQLKWIKDILIRLHERFYISSISESQRDQLTVSSLLKQMRLEVLGCPGKSATNVVLSGLVPLHKQQEPQYASIARPPVVRYAQDLGATVLPHITKDVTHVIAARDGTDKLKMARETLRGCATVHVSWLMDCYWSMSKQDVKDHWLGKLPTANEENHQKRLLLTGSDESEDEDEDDEDFATEFENDFMEQY